MSEEITRICNTCEVEKPISKFRSKLLKSGSESYSRKCRICQDRWTKRNKIVEFPHRMPFKINGELFKVCSKCGLSKSISEFHKLNKKKVGVNSKCKECVHAYYRTRRPAPPPKPAYFNDKHCVSCGLTKSLKSFIQKKRKDGSISFTPKCINCYRGSTQKNRPYFNETTKSWYKLCVKCQEHKPIENFCKSIEVYNRKTKYCYCYSCAYISQENVRKRRKLSGKDRVYKNEVYRNNPLVREKKRVRAKIKRQNLTPEQRKRENELSIKNQAKRRARKYNSPFVVGFTKKDIIARDGLKCYLCHKHLSAENAEIEHIIPLSRGGSHKPENAKIACKFCNRSKNAKFLTEFKKWRGDYSRFQTKQSSN